MWEQVAMSVAAICVECANTVAGIVLTNTESAILALRSVGYNVEARRKKSTIVALRQWSLMAHRVSSRQHTTSVAFGAKRTLTEPRLEKADL
jgi:hypothetical protein